jgi:hypothetical protein
MEYCLVLDGSFLDDYHVSQSRDAKRLLGGYASTGPDGKFVLPGLAAGWTYRISCCPGTVVNGNVEPFVTLSTFTPARTGITQLGDIKRPRTQTMDDLFLSASSAPEQIEKVLESATESARRLDQRVLIVAGSRENEIVRALRAILALSAPVTWTPGPPTGPGAPQWASGTPLRIALLNYSVFGVEVGGPRATTGTFLDRYKVTMPKTGDVTLVALDVDGHLVTQTSGQQLFAGKKASAQPLEAWLLQHAPKMADARKLLAEGLAQAKQEDKRVFLRESSPAGGALCSRLERYVEKYKSLIEKDYVCVKIDARCQNADEVFNGIRDYDVRDFAGGGFTLPWMMILDAAGKPLVSGTSPRGNIGIPESAQETSYFAWMLRATSQRLTEAEIATLVSGLNKDRR